MKIAVLAHLRFPIRQPFLGGLERFVHSFVTELLERGHDVTTFCHPESDPALNIGNVEFLPLTTNGEEYTERSHHSWLEIIRHLERQSYDIIHDNSLNYFPLVLERQLASPLVMSLHCPPFPQLESAVRYRESLGTGRYIAISDFSRTLWNLPTTRTTTVLNGVDLDRFEFNPIAIESSAVWTGRIIPEKGTHLAIEAAKIAGFSLTIAGPKSDTAYFNEYIAPHLGETVAYAGHLSNEELKRLLQNASVALCTPLWSEPFGLVAVESLACGTPVAGFKKGGLPEIIDETCGVLIEEPCVHTLAKAIQKAALISRFSCRRRVEKYFCFSQMVDNYLDVFKSIIRLEKDSKSCTLDTIYTHMEEDILTVPSR